MLNPHPDEGNLRPDYYHLLAKAHEAGKAADLFDLDSEDAASLAEWTILANADAAAQRALIAFVTINAAPLIKNMSLGA